MSQMKGETREEYSARLVAYAAKYYAAHRDERVTYSAKYAAAHRAEQRAYAAKYNAWIRAHRVNARLARFGIIATI